MKKTTQTLRVGASSLVYWAAAKFSQKNDKPDVTKAVQALFAESATDALAQRFLETALSGMPRTIVPFARDPIDIYATALHEKNILDADLVFFDETTQIEAGYFRLSKKDITYIDEVQPISEALEYFNLDKVAHTLQLLASLDRQPPKLTLYEDDASDLQVHTELANLLVSKDDSADAALYIFDFEKIRSRSVSIESFNLGRFQLRTNPEGLTLKINKPEKILELHAASLQGYWALIQANEFKFICPLPDFTEDRQAKAGWLYPINLLQRLTPRADQVLTVDIQDAKEIFGSHRWFGCNTLDQWLEVIALTEQSS